MKVTMDEASDLKVRKAGTGVCITAISSEDAGWIQTGEINITIYDRSEISKFIADLTNALEKST